MVRLWRQRHQAGNRLHHSKVLTGRDLKKSKDVPEMWWQVRLKLVNTLGQRPDLQPVPGHLISTTMTCLVTSFLYLIDRSGLSDQGLSPVRECTKTAEEKASHYLTKKIYWGLKGNTHGLLHPSPLPPLVSAKAQRYFPSDDFELKTKNPETWSGKRREYLKSGHITWTHHVAAFGGMGVAVHCVASLFTSSKHLHLVSFLPL